MRIQEITLYKYNELNKYAQMDALDTGYQLLSTYYEDNYNKKLEEYEEYLQKLGFDNPRLEYIEYYQKVQLKFDKAHPILFIENPKEWLYLNKYLHKKGIWVSKETIEECFESFNFEIVDTERYIYHFILYYNENNQEEICEYIYDYLVDWMDNYLKNATEDHEKYIEELKSDEFIEKYLIENQFEFFADGMLYQEENYRL